MNDFVVGVDLGGTNLRARVLSPSDQRMYDRVEALTPAQEEPAVVIRAIAGLVDEAVEKAGLERRCLRACGVGVPGPLDWQSGVVFSLPNFDGDWKNVPLADNLRELLEVPCYIENDANAACYGEFWLGTGRGAENMCLLTLGTGVGGGLIAHGRLLRGMDGTAAEIGHMKVERDGRPCGCGANGCLEQYASVTGLKRTAWLGIAAGKETVLRDMCGNNFDTLTGRMISDAVDQGDEFAFCVMQETAMWLGIGVSNLINLLNPERVVLYGGMTAAGEKLFVPVRETAKRLSFDVPANRAEIVPAKLGDDAGVVGAAGLAILRLAAG